MLIDSFIISSSSPEFKMTVDTTAAGGATAADQFQLKLANGPTNFTIDWGDGNSDVITSFNQAELLHTYAVGGSYQISIDGSFHGFNNQYHDDGKMMSIDNWGNNVWGTCANAFFYCQNLVANYSDTPDFSQVTDFTAMFQYCFLFNGSVDGWDTSSATHMVGMFFQASVFNQPIAFDTSSVTTMYVMFQQAAAFNQPINFDGSSLTTIQSMFAIASSMNSPVTITNSTLLDNCSGMFSQASAFNADVTLTTTNVTNMTSMFQYLPLFNGVITFNGGTGNVTNMNNMFSYAGDFNQPLTFLNDTSNVVKMGGMFKGANQFNQSVSSFNTSNVDYMAEMFKDCWVFNQPVPFDTSKLTTMYGMFFSCFAFDQAINFNTTLVTDMSYMFVNCSKLNSPITFNDTSKVTTMLAMFSGCYLFNQDISSFDITLLTTAAVMLNYSNSFSQANYDLLLVAWNAFGTSSVPFHAGTAQYTAPVSAPDTARTAMISRGWTITDGGPA